MNKLSGFLPPPPLLSSRYKEMLDLVTPPSLTVNKEYPDILKLNLSNTYATVPDDIEGKLTILLQLQMPNCESVDRVVKGKMNKHMA